MSARQRKHRNLPYLSFANGLLQGFALRGNASGKGF